MRRHIPTLLVIFTTIALTIIPETTIAGSGVVGDISQMASEVGAVEGSHFEVIDSSYLNIRLDSSEKVTLRVESVPDILTINISKTTNSVEQTTIIIGGLDPNTTYYKYEDSYRHLTQFVTNTSGEYVYIQDISLPHVVFIQPHKSTKFISDDATGGDCVSFGVWDYTHKTCTLTQDLFETIQVESDNITIDGNNFVISGFHTGSGIYWNGKSGVRVRNMHIENFSYGVSVYNSSNSSIEENNFVNVDYAGIVLSNSLSNNITRNTVSLRTPSTSRHQGLVLYGSHDNLFEDNNITFMGSSSVAGRHQGILLFDSHRNIFETNTISEMYQGVLLFNSNYNVLSSGNIFNTYQGVLLYGSQYNVLRENNIHDNQNTGLGIYSPSGNNDVYQNNFVHNLNQVAISGASINTFSKPMSIGGNYWSNFDEEGEGCSDTNNDGICDSPYLFIGGQDYLPWKIQEAWRTSSSTGTTSLPTLSFATGTPNGIWEDDGIQDGKGTASSTVFMFSTIYTSAGNIAPSDVTLRVLLSDLTDVATFPLTRDLSATTTLHDGNYRNGEQYFATSTFPKDEYKYFFEAHVGSSTLTFPNTILFPTFKTGYSNVAFLPGHQASRLYHTNPDDNTEKQIWDPEFIHDNGDLYLNPDGTSQKSDIYIKTSPSNGVIDEAYGANVYKNFMTFMDTKVVGEDVINEWEVLPYDWRLDFATLMETGKRDGNKVSYINGITPTPFILEELGRLASTSDTGKVTIITHSNGGLLAKYILATLGAASDPLVGRVDKLIMVAPPQLGTPKAVAGLLHGDEIGIAKGFILRKSTARELGENMISAYNLLPSAEYFNIVQDPVITFDKSVTAIPQIGDLASTTITDEGQLAYFVLGRNGLWAEPEAGDTDTPNVLKSLLLGRAISTHALIDYWSPPQGMQVIQIAGHGEDTVKSVSYDCGLICSSLSSIDRDVVFTAEGDGTVLMPSALSMSTSTSNIERWWLNLKNYNDQNIVNRDHADILEVPELQKFIKKILKGVSEIDGSVVVNNKPPVDNASKRLRFQLHSPVSLHLYDGYGNHTGVVNTYGTSSDMTFIEEDVPNSYYFEFGEAKYAGMSKDANTMVKLNGEALGTFTFDIDEVAGDTTTASTTFVDIPVTASTTATLIIPSGGVGTTSIPQLALDVDGDGITDTTLQGGTIGVTTDQLTTILKGIIKTLNMPLSKKSNLLKKIDKLEKELVREHKNQKVEVLKTNHAFAMVEDAIKRFQKKGILTADEATELLSIVGHIKELVIK